MPLQEKKKPKKSKKEKRKKNNRSRGRSGIALSALCRHPPSTFKSHQTGFHPVLQKTPSSPLSPHSPATAADRQPAAAEYPSLSNNQVSSHGSRKGVVHHHASSPLHQLPVLHRPQVAPIKRSSLYCTVGKQQQLSHLSHSLPRTSNIGGH